MRTMFTRTAAVKITESQRCVCRIHRFQLKGISSRLSLPDVGMGDGRAVHPLDVLTERTAEV